MKKKILIAGGYSKEREIFKPQKQYLNKLKMIITVKFLTQKWFYKKENKKGLSQM